MSDEVAASSAVAQRGQGRAQRVLLGGQPGRAHPDADGAERQRGGDLPAAADPARREHRYLAADRVHDLRDEHHAGDLAGVPARLVALGHHDVDPASHVAARVVRLPGQRGDQHAAVVRPLDDVRGRRARARSRSAGPDGPAPPRRAAGPPSAASRARRPPAGEPSGSGGTPSLSSVCSTKSRCPSGISWPRSTGAPSAGTRAGITTSTPYGRPSVLPSIQAGRRPARPGR